MLNYSQGAQVSASVQLILCVCVLNFNVCATVVTHPIVCNSRVPEVITSFILTTGD